MPKKKDKKKGLMGLFDRILESKKRQRRKQTQRQVKVKALRGK